MGNNYEVNFTDEQVNRLDEIDNAVLELCKVLLENDTLEWDASYMGEIADAAADILVATNHSVRYPTILYDGNGKDVRIIDWMEPDVQYHLK